MKQDSATRAAVISANARSGPGSIHLDFLGREWMLYRPADLESIWDSITEEAFAEDERLPYWVELWPSSLALALWLEENKHDIAGKTCLDIGCGLGFTTLAASWLGARVLGMDYEREALLYAARNAAANGIARAAFTVMDWRRPAVAAQSCERIWGGDIMYESRFVVPVFDFLNHALAPGGKVWIAEPGRNAYGTFMSLLIHNSWRARRVASGKVSPPHAQKIPVSVSLWELERGRTH